MLAAVRPLVPLYAHRYLPSDPHAAGNPVLSVMQADIIVYGSDLADYFTHEFGTPDRGRGTPPRTVPFWSAFVG